MRDDTMRSSALLDQCGHCYATVDGGVSMPVFMNAAMEEQTKWCAVECIESNVETGSNVEKLKLARSFRSQL